MHVLEDKHHIICQKIIPTGLFVLLFLTRLLTFYEIKGIRVLNGLDSLMDHKMISPTNGRSLNLENST